MGHVAYGPMAGCTQNVPLCACLFRRHRQMNFAATDSKHGIPPEALAECNVHKAMSLRCERCNLHARVPGLEEWK
jgi:hypothetical protein